MRRALAIDETFFGPDHPNVATALNNLARLLQDTNRLEGAEPLYRRAWRSTRPRTVPTTQPSLQFSTAWRICSVPPSGWARPSHCSGGLAIWEKSLGPEHSNVATALNDLAVLLQTTNRPSEAEPLVRRMLAISESSYGPDHPAFAQNLNRLAVLLRATNRLDEAEGSSAALAISESSYGPDHPAFAQSLSNLAMLLQVNNRPGEAEPLFRRALAIDEASYGSKHTTVAGDLNNLAALLLDTNRVSEAETLLRRAISINVDLFGPGHSEPREQPQQPCLSSQGGEAIC